MWWWKLPYFPSAKPMRLRPLYIFIFFIAGMTSDPDVPVLKDSGAKQDYNGFVSRLEWNECLNQNL